MFNPRQFTPGYVRDSKPWIKRYLPFIKGNRYGGKMLHTGFKTATAALEYAKRFHARWIRLYSATIAAMTKEA